MGQILQNWRILVSAFLSVTLIVGAYLLAQSVQSPRSAEASPESALLQAIATKDSDGDGLSDWEEALYGTNQNITDSFKLGMTDGAAVTNGLIVPKAIADISVTASLPTSVDSNGLPRAPSDDTLTAVFSKHFFTSYLSAKQDKGGADLSEEEMANIANESLNALSSAVAIAPDFKSLKDLTVSVSGADALKEFAVKAEAILIKNKANASKSEISYLQDAVQNNDASALTHIASIAKAYRDSAVGLAALPVPSELAEEVLALINAMIRVSAITADFARVNDDPLATMLALKQYPQTVLAIGTAFINISEAYRTAEVSMPTETPGASFVNLIIDVANEQAAAKKL